LHRSRLLSVAVLAISAYMLVIESVRTARVQLPSTHRPSSFILGQIVGVWLLGTLAWGCNERLERFFYSLVVLYFVLAIFIEVVSVPLPLIRMAQLVCVGLWLVATIVSSVIVFLHARNQESTRD